MPRTTDYALVSLSTNGYWAAELGLVFSSPAASDYEQLLASKRAAEQQQKLCGLFVGRRRSTHKTAVRAVVRATQRLGAAQVSPDDIAVLVPPGSGKTARFVELYLALERRASRDLFSLGQRQALDEWVVAALRALFAGVEESVLRCLVHAVWRSAATRENLDDKRASRGAAVLQELAHSISRHAPPDPQTQGLEWSGGETELITTLASNLLLGRPARPCPWVGRRASNGRRIDLRATYRGQGDFGQSRSISRERVVGIAPDTRPKTCGRGHGELRSPRSCRHPQFGSRGAGARKEMAHARAETHSWRNARAAASSARRHEGQDLLGRPWLPKDDRSAFRRRHCGSRGNVGSMGWAREWR